MKRGHFLAAIMLSRLCFMIPEVRLGILASWALVSFGLALRWFRWS